MPVVPSYDNTTVAPTNLPDTRQQVPTRMMQQADIGPGEQIRLGQAIQHAGAEGMQEIVAQQIQDTESKAKNGSTAYIAGSNAILHGAPGNSADGTPPDPSTGYLYKNGSDAVDGYKDTVKALADLKQKTLDGMDNNAQRQAVQNALELHYQSAVTMAAEHAAKQRGVRDMADSKTRQSVSIDAAAKSFDPLMDKASYIYDPDKPDTSTPYQQYLHVANVEASTQAGIQGITDPVARTEYVRLHMQDAYTQTFNNLLKGGDPGSGQTAIAKKYYNEVKDQLDTTTQDKIQSILNVSGRQDNEVTVQRVLEKLPGGFKAKYAALNDAFDNKKALGGVAVDGALYKSVKAGLENTETHATQAQNKVEASMVGQAQDWVLKNPGQPISKMPREMYLGLEAKGHLAALDSFATRENITPPTTWFNVQTHVGDGSERDIAKMSDAGWLNMRAQMSDRDWKSFSKARDDFINGDIAPRNDPGNLHLGTFNSALNSRLQGIQIDPKKTVSDDQKARVGAIQQFASQWVINDQQAAGHRFNDQETQKSLDRLFATNVSFRGTFLGITLQDNPRKMIGMNFDDIPSEARDGIAQGLIAAGNPTPSHQDVMVQYWRLHGKH